MTHFEIREKFRDFFVKKGHAILPSSSLIPQSDPSILFVNAGMNQFKDIFLGLKKPEHQNILTVQKCLRAGGKHNDLEDVGRSYFHHTFFEMLGNFSFGGYFKKRAIALAWEFLTQELSLDERYLWVSVHVKDKESYSIWTEQQNIPANKIYKLGDKDNFWQMGETGPCGYCTEIHYYKGDKTQPAPEELTEIWNLVFMEFYDTHNNTREKLAVPCVDTGMGLERLASLLQNKKSNYHNDLFKPAIHTLERETLVKYDFNETQATQQQKAFRVLVDHSRAICFLITDGVWPSNEGAGYVLRRLIRRALYYSQKLNPQKNLLQTGSQHHISVLSEIYPELMQNKNSIEKIIQSEAKKFFNSLKEGRKKLEEKMQSLPDKFIDQKTAWDLYSTYGFPMDLTRLIAKEKSWSMVEQSEIEIYKKQLAQPLIDQSPKALNSINKNQTEQKRIESYKQQSSQINSKLIKKELEKTLTSLLNIKTLFTGYQKDQQEAKLLFIAKNDSSKISLQNSLKKSEIAFLIFNQTCFYPEGGGPLGDKGFIKTPQVEAQILDCFKVGDTIIHTTQILNGELNTALTYKLEVYPNYRRGIKSHHTATHLLNSALRAELGNSIKQVGSLVESYYLRFDFTVAQALTKKNIQQIEKTVLTNIQNEEPVQPSYKTFKETQKESYIYLQGENYPETVRVLKIGTTSSKELCGGIHVKNTKEIQNFKIIKEEGVGSGIRRITAYTNSSLKAWESFLVKQNLTLREFLRLLKNDTFKQGTKKPFSLWEGKIETENIFLIQLEQIEKQIKQLKKNLIRFQTKPYYCNPTNKLTKENQVAVKSYFHPLATQMLQLREFLKLPLPKIKGPQNYETIPDFVEDSKNNKCDHLALEFFQKKEEEKTMLQKVQNKSLNLTQVEQKVKSFEYDGLKIQSLILLVPIEDRKILTDMSDFLLSQLKLSIIVLVGESDPKHPVFVNVDKSLTSVLRAGEILKNQISKLCEGKGGGKAGFAQGSIKNRDKILELDKILFNS